MGSQQLYSLIELAKLMGTSKSYVYHNWKDWVLDRGLKVMFVGDRPRISATEVEKLFKSFEVNVNG